MNINLQDAVQSALISCISLLFGWIFGYKRNKKEIDKIHIENIENIISLYKNMLDDLSKRYTAQIEELKQQCGEYERHIQKLEERVEILTNKMRDHGIQF